MTVNYYGEHSITFESMDGTSRVNTWDNWFLVPVSRPTMTVPGAQNKFVEIPGMNGSYDFSDYLVKDITYADRSGSFEFLVDTERIDWMAAYRMIMTYLHGQRLRMYLTDDADWYYEGRFSVDSFKSDQTHSSITISYRVGPFKIHAYSEYQSESTWDPFNFDTDEDWSVLHEIVLNDQIRVVAFDIAPYSLRKMLMARMPASSYQTGDIIEVVFNGLKYTLNQPGQEVAITTSGQFVSTIPITIFGWGTVDIGWRKISL